MIDPNAPDPSGKPGASRGRTIYRHRISTRLWHWLNALTLIVLLMSGLMIFNAHPRLYWGQYGANYDRSWLEIGSRRAGTEGFFRVGDWTVETTGVLGSWTDADGATQRRAFPGWATIPSYYSLSAARRWHLSFAWLLVVPGLAYLCVSLINGHVRRDLVPRAGELRPAHLMQEVRDHALGRPGTDGATGQYNSLQKMSYLGVLFGLLPLIVLSGLTMSPALNAAWPWMLDVLGGRASARSIHFICAFLLTLFIIVHLVMVIVAGPISSVRSMITGRHVIPEPKK